MTFLDYLSSLNIWIVAHKELLTVIAIPLFTYFVTTRANAASETRAHVMAVSERELKKAMFEADRRIAETERLNKLFLELVELIDDKSISGNELARRGNQGVNALALSIDMLDGESRELIRLITSSLGAPREESSAAASALVTAFSVFLEKRRRNISSSVFEGKSAAPKPYEFDMTMVNAAVERRKNPQ